MDVLFSAVFQQASLYTPDESDPWGNPLIPIYKDLPRILTEGQDPNSTINVDVKKAQYASYYGIPLAKVNEDIDGGYDGTWNFSMESSYLSLTCPPLNFSLWDDIADQLLESNEVLDDYTSTTGDSLWMNMTAPKSIAQPGNITFVSGCSKLEDDDGKLLYAWTHCSLQQTFVQSYVTCQGTNCKVVEITPLPTEQPTKMQNFMPEFIKASDTGLSFYPTIGDTPYSITELYLYNKYTATAPGAGDNCDLSKGNSTDITDDLAYLVNTFYSTGFAHNFTVGAIAVNATVPLVDSSTGETIQQKLMTSTMAIHDYTDEYTPTLYGIHKQWLGVYIGCAAALLLIGIFGILLESRTIAPDILGFASSVARHSRYVKLPKVDGTMSGGERARRTRDCVVMMQDVRPDDPVGKIVLGSATPGAVRLTPTRPYK